MKLSQFDLPANLTDLDVKPVLKKAWSDLISNVFDAGVRRAEHFTGVGKSQFYNPAKLDTDPPVSKTISWGGFPRVLLRKHRINKLDAWKDAETLRSNGEGRFRPQDEYLEWHTETVGDKVRRVTFTCEGPEYWELLVENVPDLALDLYRKYISSAVQMSDLLVSGKYNHGNKWNTELGAMHLTHPSNSLVAEIFIAADATVLREKNGQPVTDADALIRCAGYGVPERASDPKIGSDVNTLARQKALISLQNPVGLYISDIDTSGWKKPDGSPVGNYWKVLRGKKGAALRAVYEVPREEKFEVGDIQIGNVPIQFGGQIAENITMKLTGIACRIGQNTSPSVPCGGSPDVAAIAAMAHAGGFKVRTRHGH